MPAAGRISSVNRFEEMRQLIQVLKDEDPARALPALARLRELLDARELELVARAKGHGASIRQLAQLMGISKDRVFRHFRHLPPPED
jgi:predicted transcriptional regulator